jgi:chromosomal replication initiation ATPase DnaA
MNTAQQSTVGFMKLVYQGGQRSHPDNRRTLVADDQCSELVNLVQETDNHIPREEEFISIIYEIFNVTQEEMLNTTCRKRELVNPRQLHIYIRRCFYKMSLAVSASVYGKDHATALHIVTVINNLIETNRLYREDTKKVWQLWFKSGVELPNEVKTFINEVLKN